MSRRPGQRAKRVLSNDEAECPIVKRTKTNELSTPGDSIPSSPSMPQINSQSMHLEQGTLASVVDTSSSSNPTPIDSNTLTTRVEDQSVLLDNNEEMAIESVEERLEDLIAQEAIDENSSRHSELLEDYRRALVNSHESFQEEVRKRYSSVGVAANHEEGVRTYIDRASSPLTQFSAPRQNDVYDEDGNLIRKTIQINGVIVHKAFSAAGRLVESDGCTADLFLELGVLKGDTGNENWAAIRGKNIVHWKVLATTETRFCKETDGEEIFVYFWVSRLATPVYMDNQDWFGAQQIFLYKAMTDCFGNDIPVRFYPTNALELDKDGEEDSEAAEDAVDDTDDTDDENDEDYQDDGEDGGSQCDRSASEVASVSGGEEDNDQAIANPDEEALNDTACSQQIESSVDMPSKSSNKDQVKSPNLPNPAGLFLDGGASFFFSPSVNTLKFDEQCSVDDVTLDTRVKDGAAAVFRANLGRYGRDKTGTGRALKKFVADTLGVAAIRFNDT